MIIKSEPFKPTGESLELIESSIKNNNAEIAQVNDWFFEYAQIHKERVSFDYDLVREYCSLDSVIVEVASMPMLLTVPLKIKKYNIHGVDISPERFQSTIDRFGLDIKKCDIEREALPFPDNYCDVVLFNEIFEHLRINLIFTMREVLRILKPGGQLFLSTPNMRSLRGIRNFLFKRRVQSNWWNIYDEYEKLEILGHMGHVREYTTTEVSDFLRRVGFNPEVIVYRGTLKSTMDNLIIRLRPNLRPYFSCIARKPF